MLEEIIDRLRADDLSTLVVAMKQTPFIQFEMYGATSYVNVMHLAVFFNATNIFDHLITNYPEMLFQDEQILSAFCPVLQEPFEKEKVEQLIRGVDGMIYEHKALQKWLEVKSTMPLNPTIRCSAAHLDSPIRSFTPFDLMVLKNNPEFVKRALERVNDVNMRLHTANNMACRALYFGNYDIARLLIQPTSAIPLHLYHANFLADSIHYMEHPEDLHNFAKFMQIARLILPTLELSVYLEKMLLDCLAKKRVSPVIGIGLLEMLNRYSHEISPLEFYPYKSAITLVLNTVIHHAYCQKLVAEDKHKCIKLIKDISDAFSINANRTIETMLHGVLGAATYNPTQAPITVAEAADLLTLTAKIMPNVFDFASSRTHQIINMMLFLRINRGVITIISDLKDYRDIEEFAPSRSASGSYKTTHKEYCVDIGRLSPKGNLFNPEEMELDDRPRSPVPVRAPQPATPERPWAPKQSEGTMSPRRLF